ncbi:ATP-binding protein [Aestuariispira insulae]|uniref:histidine kinase n=1 Tax=Aestuariispira insulae TaxID=1461337 RepID=A0A3D9H6J6_9PROT|nr:ATP-binding protein [Aestuariispira insulae]RED45120.1 signal transduction histidine kinase [Aestuariispira insulae]
METFIESLARGYVALIANIGLLAILAWCVSLFGRHLFVEDYRPNLTVATVLGLTFGSAAALLMNLPVEFQPGIFGDARGAPLMMSGLVGGPVAMVITALMAAATRLWLGGTGADAGVVAIFIYALAGYAWRRMANRIGSTGISTFELVGVSFFTTALTSPVVLFMPSNVQLAVLTSLWPKLWAANILGTLILGSLIHREIQRQQAEHELMIQRVLSERATVAKSKFLAAMSHEIRTPLNGILGIIQLLMNRDLEKPIRDDLKIAQDSGFYLLSLLNQVLDFARIESGQSSIERRQFKVASIIDSLHSIFARQAEAKGLELEVTQTGPCDQDVEGDFNHIRQILFNLMGNALKFTEKGKITLTVRQEQEEDQYRVQFEVTDTGPGIPEKDLGLIFEEFQQSETGRAMPGGSGLGLSIALQLATAMGASLSVRSTLGEGTAFSLMVMVDKAAPRANPLPSPESASHDLPLNILLTEDNEINQRIAKAMLEEMNCKVTIAENGREALQCMTQQPDRFDLIFMDIQMPIMDGIEATKRIKALPLPAGAVPIVALTANAFDEQRAEYLESGMEDVLTKPLHQGELDQFLTYFRSDQDISDRPQPSKQKPELDHGEMVNGEIVKQVITTLTPSGARSFYDDAQSRSHSLIERLKANRNEGRDTQTVSHELRSLLSSIGFQAAVEITRQIEFPEPDQTDPEQLIEALESCLDASVIIAKKHLEGIEDTIIANKEPES